MFIDQQRKNRAENVQSSVLDIQRCEHGLCISFVSQLNRYTSFSFCTQLILVVDNIITFEHIFRVLRLFGKFVNLKLIQRNVVKSENVKSEQCTRKVSIEKLLIYKMDFRFLSSVSGFSQLFSEQIDTIFDQSKMSDSFEI